MFLRTYGLGDWPGGSPAYDFPSGGNIGDRFIDGPVRIYNYHRGSGGWWGEVWQPHGRVGTLQPGGRSGRFTELDASVPIYSSAQIQAYLNPPAPPPPSAVSTTPVPPAPVATEAPTVSTPTTPPPAQITTAQLAEQIAQQVQQALSPNTTPSTVTTSPPPLFSSATDTVSAPVTQNAVSTIQSAETASPIVPDVEPVSASILPSTNNPWVLVLAVGIAVSLFLGSRQLRGSRT